MDLHARMQWMGAISAGSHTRPVAGHAVYYARHRPEQTLLYQVVEEYYPAFLNQMAIQGTTLPEYVQRDFDDYLKCGRLEYGFLRVRCTRCHQEQRVAFSCKRRGSSPSPDWRRDLDPALRQRTESEYPFPHAVPGRRLPEHRYRITPIPVGKRANGSGAVTTDPHPRPAHRPLSGTPGITGTRHREQLSGLGGAGRRPDEPDSGPLDCLSHRRRPATGPQGVYPANPAGPRTIRIVHRWVGEGLRLQPACSVPANRGQFCPLNPT